MADNVDWAGVAHAPAERSPRIACLVPSVTELLFALELGERVVARTGFCVHPHDAVRRVRKIGGTKDPDLAQLRALAPTHLVVNVDENRREVVDAARAFVPNIVVTHPLVLDDNLRLYRLLGSIFDRPHQATALCERFAEARARLRTTTVDLPRERVLYLVWKKPWMTVSRATYIADVLATCGWDVVEPAGAQQRYPALADDDAAWRAADRILLATEPYAFGRREVQRVQEQHGRPALLIDGEMTSWYGPRAIAGMAYLAALRGDRNGDTRDHAA